MHVCVCVYVHVSVYVCMYTSVYVCMYIYYTHVYIPVWLLLLLYQHTVHVSGSHYTVCKIVDLSRDSAVLPRAAAFGNLYLYVCMYVCMRVCVYACMYVCVHTNF